jgi:hypothetical protein
MIGQVFRVLWQAIKDFWDELFRLMLMNIVTTLPIIVALGILSGLASLWGAGYVTLAQVLTVTLLVPVAVFPPAVAGLWSVANRAADQLAIHWSDYYEGFRRYFWKAWVFALINIVVAAVVGVNIWFYAPGNSFIELNATVGATIQMFLFIAAILWLIYQMYPLAMLLEQTDVRVRTALRNAAVLFLTKPGFTILLALLLAIVVGASTYFVIPWFLFSLALVAVVCNKAVKHLLEPYREQAAKEAAEAADEEGKEPQEDVEVEGAQATVG